MSNTNDKSRIVYIGHSSVLIQLNGQNFYIDPNFSTRVWGFKRHAPVGIDLNNLPPPTAILVTHAHYDHLDIHTYKYFSQKVPILTPKGLAGLIKRYLKNPVVELAAWDHHQTADISLTAVPTKHHGFRVAPWRYNGVTGYVISDGQNKIYHPGDTAYGPHFTTIRERVAPTVACLPIGAFRPRWFMKSRHMSPHDALRAAADLNVQTMIPIHWGAFQLATDRLDEAIGILKQERDKQPKLTALVKILMPGESLDLN